MRFHLRNTELRNADSRNPSNANIVYDMFSIGGRPAARIPPDSRPISGPEPSRHCPETRRKPREIRDAFLHEPIWL